ncbi:MAG: hypothetical protein JST02_00675 [Bacteroidetes bacterium]|nr:hypothetical protein [Bacteroidota bacterium]
MLHRILHKFRIIQLRNKIRKARKAAYLDLYERIELRDTIALLEKMEERMSHKQLLSLR